MKINDKIGAGPKEPYNKNVLYGPEGISPSGDNIEYIGIREINNDMLKGVAVSMSFAIASTNLNYIGPTGTFMMDASEDLQSVVAIAINWDLPYCLGEDCFTIETLPGADLRNKLQDAPRLTKEQFYNAKYVLAE